MRTVKVLKRKPVERAPSYSYDPIRDGVTQGALVTFLECRKKIQLGLVKGLIPLRESTPLTWGTLAHAILERYYRDGLTDFRDFFEEYARDHGVERWSAEQVQEYEITTGQIDSVLKAYAKYWKKEDDKKDWVAQESRFRIPLEVEWFKPIGKPGEGEVKTYSKVPVLGMRDGLYKLRSKLWLFETKTKGQIDEEAIMDTLERDFQTQLYSWATAKEFGTLPVGVLYNVVRRPGLRLGKKETLDEYFTRVDGDIVERPEHYFKRFEYTIDQHLAKQFDEELKSLVKEYLEWFYGGQPTRIFGNPCTGRYGTCPLLPVCYYNKKHLFKVKRVPFLELE